MRIEPKTLTTIKLSNVYAIYQVPTEKVFSFKEYIIRKITFNLSYQKLVALNDINLEINKGEVLGIIGRNGAGKSTLLKIISRVLPPSDGNVFVRGRVAPLLTLGAGFNPELTGRENILLNGAILCLSELEIRRNMERIVEFSGLTEFIDSPLRTYSSGMIARLGFAVATTLDPDILIIDEILSVGDEDFRTKSFSKILEFKGSGVTIVLVSHNLEVIKDLCDRVLWLENGKEKMIGAPREVVRRYRADIKSKQN